MTGKSIPKAEIIYKKALSVGYRKPISLDNEQKIHL